MAKEFNTWNSQKNLNGSYWAGLIATPETLTLLNSLNSRNKLRQWVIDLSTENTEEANMEAMNLNSSPQQTKQLVKRQCKDRHPQPQHGKTTQWKESEYKKFSLLPLSQPHSLCNNWAARSRWILPVHRFFKTKQMPLSSLAFQLHWSSINWTLPSLSTATTGKCHFSKQPPPLSPSNSNTHLAAK